jgi:hypothetical protein
VVRLQRAPKINNMANNTLTSRRSKTRKRRRHLRIRLALPLKSKRHPLLLASRRPQRRNPANRSRE